MVSNQGRLLPPRNPGKNLHNVFRVVVVPRQPSRQVVRCAKVREDYLLELREFRFFRHSHVTRLSAYRIYSIRQFNQSNAKRLE